MKIKNKIFYHIHHSEEDYKKLMKTTKSPYIFEVGSTLLWDGTRENFFNDYWNYHSFTIDLGNSEMDFSEAMKLFSESNNEFKAANWEKMLQKSRSVINNYKCFVRETIFEEVRRDKFKELPSRKTCLWVSDKEHLKGWWDSSFKGERNLYKLSLSGLIHKGSNDYLKTGTFAFDRYRENAHKYWDGIDGQNKNDFEYIFQGEVKILERYSDYDEFKENEL